MRVFSASSDWKCQSIFLVLPLPEQILQHYQAYKSDDSQKVIIWVKGFSQTLCIFHFEHVFSGNNLSLFLFLVVIWKIPFLCFSCWYIHTFKISKLPVENWRPLMSFFFFVMFTGISTICQTKRLIFIKIILPVQWTQAICLNITYKTWNFLIEEKRFFIQEEVN